MEQPLKELMPIHLGFLKDAEGFPAECVLSSHLLYTQLQNQYPDLKIVYGTW